MGVDGGGWQIGGPVDCARCPVDRATPCRMCPDRAVRALL